MKNQKKSNIKRKCFLTAAVLLFAAIVTACIFYVNHKRAFSVSPLTQSMIDELDLKDASKLMIVAHPDDETIWGGAHLLDRGYLVVCLTDGYNKKRASEFNEAVKASGNTPLILDYPDKVNFKRADWSEITDDIEADIELIMSAKHWDIAVTHNPKGEYGHIHHKKTNAITVKAFNKTKGADKLYFFGDYYKASDIGSAAEKLTPISQSELEQKKKLCDIYRSQKRVMENLSHMFLYENWKEYGQQ